MPMHMSIFHHDFPQIIFHQGGPWRPLKIAYGTKQLLEACCIQVLRKNLTLPMQ